MIAIETKNDTYEMRAEEESIVLYQSGVYRGKIISSRNLEVGKIGIFECKEERSSKGRAFWTTGTIKKIMEV